MVPVGVKALLALETLEVFGNIGCQMAHMNTYPV
ncbi:hypothetical protein PMIT1318_00080 [Prochlorococcus marinus str. MIT 1318]|nr:hypothetical protein PMIT1318_00080 [Prochlorococcus marinus str. MIT 1318]